MERSTKGVSKSGRFFAGVEERKIIEVAEAILKRMEPGLPSKPVRNRSCLSAQVLIVNQMMYGYTPLVITVGKHCQSELIQAAKASANLFENAERLRLTKIDEGENHVVGWGGCRSKQIIVVVSIFRGGYPIGIDNKPRRNFAKQLMTTLRWI